MFRYLPVILLICIPFLAHAQLIEAPLNGNPILQQLHQEPTNQQAIMPNCPNLNGTFYYVDQGDTIQISFDTTGIGYALEPTLSLLECDDLTDLGTTSFENDQIFYIAPNEDGYQETICVEYCPDQGDCDSRAYTIITRRPSETYILPTVQTTEETTEEICLDASSLPGDLTCNVFFECDDDYNSIATTYWTTYDVPTTCFYYNSGLGAGVDTICARLCDNFGVCDEYKIPVEVQSYFLDLPFFDDFANNDGPYPSSDRWVSKDGYVNNTMAQNPPSVGMLTLDGLDYKGSPYPNAGEADFMTSRGINLGNVGNLDVGLRFYVAPKGNGLYPNGPDSLKVEFKHANGVWEEQWIRSGIDSTYNLEESPAFEFVTLGVPAEFHYDGFQFRFINQVSPVGLYDMWHIDYVRLAADEPFNDTFDDVAFVDIPNSLLQEYEHMPIDHFLADLGAQITVMEFESVFYNHQDFTANPANDSDILLRETTTNTNIPVNLNVLDAVNVPSKEYAYFSKLLPANNAQDIRNAIGPALNGLEQASLELSYRFTLSGQEITINDQVFRTHELDNYFAYDDGTAERQVYLENPQTDNPELALEFRSVLEDTLKAIQFHFPHVNGNAENQLFSLHIYLDELDNEPELSMEFLSPLYADSKFDTLQGLTTYTLKNIFGQEEGLPIQAGQTFYVGFQQLTSANFGIPIGLDIHRDISSKLYLNIWDNWENMEGVVKGAPMIRAVVGQKEVIETPTKEVAIATEQLKIFPNPASSIINLKGIAFNATDQLIIFDHSGKQVGSFDPSNEINVTELEAGMYLLCIQDELGQVQHRTKFVIIR